MQPLKKFIIGSLIAHCIIIVVTGVVSFHHDKLKRTLVVFGAHSRKASAVSYKSKQAIVPFSGPQKTRPVNSASTQKNKISAKRKGTKNSKNPKISAAKKKATIKKQKPTKKSIPKRKKSSLEKIKEPTTKASVDRPGKGIKAISAANLKKLNAKKSSDKKLENKPNKIPKEKIIKETLEDAHLPDDTRPEETASPEPVTHEIPFNDEFNLVGSYSSEEIMIYHKHVQAEVDRLWHPPVGVPQGTVCTVLFTLDAKGNVTTELLERSSVLIYDLSIMSVARNFSFHQSLWGKKFKIAFRQ